MKKKKVKKTKAPKVDPYLEGLVTKLLDRFVNLEKKVDILLAQTNTKTTGNGQVSGGHSSQAPASPPRKHRTLFEVRCSACHVVCEVPFRPTESRPVFCKPCFALHKSGQLNSQARVTTTARIPQKTAVESFPSSIPKATAQIQALNKHTSAKPKSAKLKSPKTIAKKSKSAKPKKAKTKRK